MNNSTKNWIIGILFLIVLIGTWIFGYTRYPVWHPQEHGSDSIVYIYDTTPHGIPDSFPFYVIIKDSIKYRDPIWMDSVIQANKVDTSSLNTIFREFYSFNYYTRIWQDTLVQISINDMITENRPDDNNFSYKLLKPLTIIDNTTTTNIYTKYLYLAGSVTLPDSKYSSFGLYGSFPKTIFGISYMPFSPGVMTTIGVKIVKFK